MASSIRSLEVSVGMAERMMAQERQLKIIHNRLDDASKNTETILIAISEQTEILQRAWRSAFQLQPHGNSADLERPTDRATGGIGITEKATLSDSKHTLLQELQELVKVELRSQEQRLFVRLENLLSSHREETETRSLKEPPLRGESTSGSFTNGSEIAISDDIKDQKSKSLAISTSAISASAMPQLLVNDPENPASLIMKHAHVKRKIESAPVFLQPFAKALFMSSFYEDFEVEQVVEPSLFPGFVVSKIFMSLSAMIVVLNSVFLGYSTDYALSNLDKPNTPFIIACTWFFFVFYAVELVLRLAVFGVKFFYNSEWAWNVFDTVLVLVSTWELTYGLAYAERATQHVTAALRIFRLLKIVKMLRILRVMRFFQGLRMFCMPMLKSFPMFLWGLLILGLIQYVFGLIFTGGVLQYEIERQSTGDLDEDLKRYWGSQSAAVDSLYESITGGTDWITFADPLKKLGVQYYLIFTFYIAFIFFSAMNVLTAMYLDTAEKFAAHERSLVMISGEVQVYRQVAFESLTTLDDDHDGKITIDQLRDHLGDVEIQIYFGALDIDQHVANYLLWRFMKDGNTTVDIEKFLDIALNLHGSARSVDMHSVVYACEDMMAFLQTSAAIGEGNKSRLEALEIKIDRLLNKTKVMPESQV